MTGGLPDFAYLSTWMAFMPFRLSVGPATMGRAYGTLLVSDEEYTLGQSGHPDFNEGWLPGRARRDEPRQARTGRSQPLHSRESVRRGR